MRANLSKSGVAGSSEVKRVALVCVNLRGNLGDYAIADSSVAYLSQAFPGCKVSLVPHGFTGVDENRTHAFSKTLAQNATLEEPTLFLSPAVFYRTLVKVGIPVPHLTSLLFYWAKNALKRDRAFQTIIGTHDLIAIAGGGHFGGSYLASNMLAQISLASDRVPVVVMPMTLTRGLRVSFQKSLFRRVLRKTRLVATRESQTLQLLRSWGIDGIFEASDTAFGHGIGAEYSCPVPEKRDRVAFIMANQGDREGPRYVESLVRAMDVVSAAGLSPIAVTTTESVDRVYLEPLSAKMGASAIARPQKWSDALRLISTCRLVVTNRFHGIVFSVLAGTPVLPVVDVAKTRNLAEEIRFNTVLAHESEIDGELLYGVLQDAHTIVQRQDTYLRWSKSRLALFPEALKRAVVLRGSL